MQNWLMASSNVLKKAKISHDIYVYNKLMPFLGGRLCLNTGNPGQPNVFNLIGIKLIMQYSVFHFRSKKFYSKLKTKAKLSNK